jgi:hypothetical protein
MLINSHILGALTTYILFKTGLYITKPNFYICYRLPEAYSDEISEGQVEGTCTTPGGV